MANPMWYNMSAINGDNGVLGLMQSVDSIFLFHMFGTLILITLFVIIFRAIVTYNNNPKVTFMYTSFFLAVLSVLFKILSLVGDTVTFIFIGIFLLSIGAQFIFD